MRPNLKTCTEYVCVLVALHECRLFLRKDLWVVTAFEDVLELIEYNWARWLEKKYNAERGFRIEDSNIDKTF